MEMPMDTKHTRGPWRLVGDRIEARGTRRLLPVAMLYRAKGHEAEDAANGALLTAAPEMLDELRRAELIILTMLNAMTDEQKALVHEQLRASFIVDDAMTRFHERRDVIERATGAPKAPPKP
jgi:hypothetical protein